MSTLNKYYSEIDDFPLWNWSKCCKGELIHCRIDVKEGSEKEDAEAWENIFNDFIAKIGLGDEYIEYLDLVKRRALLQLEYLETRQRRVLNEVNLLTNTILSHKERIKSDSNGSIAKTLNWLSRREGYPVKIKDTTTLAYFELIKEANTASNG